MVFWFSLGILLVCLAIYGEVFRGWRRLRYLRDAAAMLPPNAPRVSVVVAARNEGHVIEPALRSILALDYPDLEVVVVDDRSTDDTGAVLDGLHREDARLQVVHVTTLPGGWLGKNHALWCGAEKTTGKYLIFTDADVVYERSAIRRATSHCEAEHLDHLTAIPDLVAHGGFLRLSLLGGFVGILALERPWRARTTRKARIGIGAFNMVRADSYRAAGGHRRLAMEVLDDIELGRMMAEGNLRQELLIGTGELSIEMYPSVAAMFSGIQKNVFTFLDYSFAKLLAATLVTFATSVWPWLGLLVADGPARWLCAASALAAVALYVDLAPRLGWSRWCVAYLPIMGLVTIALMWQVAIRTWMRGGIVWRGTFYPLEELRSFRRSGG